MVVSLLIVGHRGASGHLPENSIPAFEKAIEMKADGVELDVWPAKDGMPVVIHDETLNRTTKGKGLVSAFSVSELKQWDVPSYAEILQLAQDKLVIFTELKGNAELEVGAMIAHAVETGAWQYAQLPVIGFDHAQLRRLKAKFPEVSIGISFSRKMLEDIPKVKQAAYMVEQALSAQADAINPDYRLVNAALIKHAHDAGLKVNVWTVNSTYDMQKMADLGVDAIMTDYPDRLHKLLHSAP